ncbi:hypothetical protein PU560_03675, partial [Georgenia sp. 10Sc9-8]|nr:hypothetical protein [Georgenia halotolerans]
MAEIVGTEVAKSCCAEPWLAECEHWRAVSVAQLAKEHSDGADTLTDGELRALEAGRVEPASPLAAAVPVDDSPAHLPAEILRELTGGPALALLLDDIALADVDPSLAVEVVAGFKRLEAWAAARAARAAAQVSRRAEMDVPDRGLEDVRRLNVAGEELAMRLGVTRAEANTLIDVGRRAFGDGSCLAPTGGALENGELDWRKTCTIVRTLRRHPDVVAWCAQERVLPGAGLRTHNQVVRDLEKALIAVDPEEADLRHRRARTERRVSRPRPLPDGMAAMTALLPAADAVLVDIALHAAAQAARRDGCGLTLDALRADALTAMATTALDTGWIGTPPRDGPSTEDAPSTEDSGAAVPVAGGPAGPGVTDLPGVRLRRRPMPVPDGRGRRTQVRITVPLSVA